MSARMLFFGFLAISSFFATADDQQQATVIWEDRSFDYHLLEGMVIPVQKQYYFPQELAVELLSSTNYQILSAQFRHTAFAVEDIQSKIADPFRWPPLHYVEMSCWRLPQGEKGELLVKTRVNNNDPHILQQIFSGDAVRIIPGDVLVFVCREHYICPVAGKIKPIPATIDSFLLEKLKTPGSVYNRPALLANILENSVPYIVGNTIYWRQHPSGKQKDIKGRDYPIIKIAFFRVEK